MWSVSSVHHALRLSHWLISHHWPVRLVVAWVTSWVSAGRKVLVVGLASSSSIRVHAHSFSIVWSVLPRTVSTVSRSDSVEVRVMAVRWHGIESWAMRTHEKGRPVASVVIVRRFVLASLSLLAFVNVEVVVAPERVRCHEFSSVSLVEITTIHRHHASWTGTTTELISSVWWGVVIPLGITSPQSDPHCEVGLSSFRVSPLVSVFVIFNRIRLEVLLPRSLLIFAASWIGFVVFLPVLLLLILVLRTFNILSVLFVPVGFWVVPTLFLLSLITFFVLFFSFLIILSWKCIVELFAFWMAALGLSSFCLLRLPFLCRRARLLLFRQWLLVSWILVIQWVFRKSCIHSCDTPSSLDLFHTLDLAFFMADDFHRVDLVQLVKFADTSFDQFY